MARMVFRSSALSTGAWLDSAACSHGCDCLSSAYAPCIRFVVVRSGNAARDGTVAVGDKLVGITAVQFIGAKWERQMFNTEKWGFDTVVDAIGSNDDKFDIFDVVLQFSRPVSDP